MSETEQVLSSFLLNVVHCCYIHDACVCVVFITSCVRVAVAQSKKKKGKYESYQKAPADSVYFLFDVETSGAKRNYDCIVAFSFLAYNLDGKLLGNYTQKVNPGKIQMSAKAMEIHGKLFDCIALTGTLTQLAFVHVHRVDESDAFPNASFSIHHWQIEQVACRNDGRLFRGSACIT